MHTYRSLTAGESNLGRVRWACYRSHQRYPSLGVELIERESWQHGVRYGVMPIFTSLKMIPTAQSQSLCEGHVCKVSYMLFYFLSHSRSESPLRFTNTFLKQRILTTDSTLSQPLVSSCPVIPKLWRIASFDWLSPNNLGGGRRLILPKAASIQPTTPHYVHPTKSVSFAPADFLLRDHDRIDRCIHIFRSLTDLSHQPVSIADPTFRGNTRRSAHRARKEGQSYRIRAEASSSHSRWVSCADAACSGSGGPGEK